MVLTQEEKKNTFKNCIATSVSIKTGWILDYPQSTLSKVMIPYLLIKPVQGGLCISQMNPDTDVFTAIAP